MINELDKMLAMSETLNKKLNLDINILDKSMLNTIKNVPEEQKAIIEKMRAMTKKAIAEAKKGNQTKATEIINKLKNECTNSK